LTEAPQQSGAGGFGDHALKIHQTALSPARLRRLAPGFALLALMWGMTACGTESSPVAESPTAAAEPAGPQQSGEPASAAFPENQAVYIRMPDGTRIAADIWLPGGTTASTQLPTLISFTRYWRASAYEPPQTGKSELFTGLNQAGYAVVVVDTRGSGASFGTRGTEFSVCETRDFKHVVDWVAEQGWSNGRVATIGVSYSGNTAEHATFDPSPALRAAVPRFTDFDGYTSILYPGGLRNRLITDNWGAAVNALDNNQVPEAAAESADEPRLLGIKPVDSDTDGTLLAEAVSQHAGNLNLTTFFADIGFRDEIAFAASLDEKPDGAECAELVSPYRFRSAVEASRIPSFHWASWVDAGTATGVIARFASYDAPAQYIIGPWTHGAGGDAGVYNPADQAVEPDVEGQYGRILDFLEPYMRGDGTAADLTPSLTYFTMGEDRWKTTDTWPPAGHSETSWYLAENNGLAAEPPASDQSGDGQDEYAVDFTAGTGALTRWTTQLGGKDIFHGDRAEADRLLLTYTSPPLATATEITGFPWVELYVSSTHEDGALIAYLESVSPDGVVSMITEGQLRLVHRKVSDVTPPYPVFGPYHSFDSADAMPMIPGEVSKVEFVMWPTSVQVPAGHSIRLAIAGHDQDTFARYPAEGDPVLTFHRNSSQPSRLVIPVIRNP
jgi:putative CocE/NonD family hydrolase